MLITFAQWNYVALSCGPSDKARNFGLELPDVLRHLKQVYTCRYICKVS